MIKTKSVLFKFNLILIATLTLVQFSESQQLPSRLIFDYKRPTGIYRIGENLVELTYIEKRQNDKIGIRLCSKLSLPKTMLNATADPFLISDKLSNSFGYSPERVVFLFSKDCVIKSITSKTEIWLIPDGATFPSNESFFYSNQISLTPVSDRPFFRGMRDYKEGYNRLIKYMKQNPSNIGVVLGYFLEKPSLSLRKRMQEIENSFKKKKIKKTQYIVLLKPWNDEVSAYPKDTEPVYPIIYLLNVPVKDKSK